MMSHRSMHLAIAGLVGVLALALRLYGLGDILTADEPRWMLHSRDYFHALSQGDPGGTFQGTHPGVVPMLLMGGGIRTLELVRGKPMEDHEIAAFRYAAKLPVATASALLVAASAASITSLWGGLAGLAAGSLLALDPYLLGHSQLAHVDALLSLLMLSTLLILLRFLETKRTPLLLLSGMLAGLALLTKLPAASVLIAGSATILLAVRPVKTKLRAMSFWLLSAALVFVLLWPSMWLNTLPNLRYAARDTRTVTTEPHRGAETADSYPASWRFTLGALARRTPPVVALLALGCLALSFSRHRGWPKRDLSVLFGTALLLFMLLTVTSKKADRYLLPVLAVLDVSAGLALARLAQQGIVGRVLAASVFFGSLLQALLLRPYAVAYANPLARPDPTQAGWGEGLERAAKLLNTHPLARELTVASWYPAVFGPFFEGRTFSLSSRRDHRVAYVVLYENMRGRGPDSVSTEILAEYARQKPHATITVLGREIAWIYATNTPVLFTAHVGELVAPRTVQGDTQTPSAVEVGQFITAEQDDFEGVGLVFATFSSRATTAAAVVSVRDNPEGPDLRTVRISADQLADGDWTELRFTPIKHSRGRQYYLAVTSEGGRPGNAVTVRYQPRDILPGSLVILRRPLKRDENRAAYRREGDLAYRLLYARRDEAEKSAATTL